MKKARTNRQAAPRTQRSARLDRNLTADELPVFDGQGQELQNFLSGRPYQPKETIVRLVRVGFYKDGVWVDPSGDFINGWGKSTACGCLYTWKAEGLKWPYNEVGPSEVIWQKPRRDWRARHLRSDWSTLDTDKPEVAPWLRKGGAHA